jgi:hypothetical protein
VLVTRPFSRSSRFGYFWRPHFYLPVLRPGINTFPGSGPRLLVYNQRNSRALPVPNVRQLQLKDQCTVLGPDQGIPMHEALHHLSIHPEQYAERSKDGHLSTLSVLHCKSLCIFAKIAGREALHREIEVPRCGVKAQHVQARLGEGRPLAQQYRNIGRGRTQQPEKIARFVHHHIIRVFIGTPYN